MRELRYTLRTDGTSDQALLPLLTWLLQYHGVNCAIQATWANLQRLRQRPKTMSCEEINWVLDLYPCDLLFVHRDAERELRKKRVAEIHSVVSEAAQTKLVPPIVCVIPVRMQEAWLLFDESALRRAAGNPNGKQPLTLPELRRLEDLPDPKNNLHNLLRDASGLHGRRRKKFDAHAGTRLIAQFVNDFSPLRTLPAFRALEAEIQQVVIQAQSWNLESEDD